MENQPEFCRVDAFTTFASQLARIDTVDGLLSAVTAIAMHELDQVSIPAMQDAMSRLADRVLRRAQSGQTTAVLANLHEVLFEEEGFSGNIEDYYRPGNSYLPEVLSTKHGLPIVLSLIYYVVGTRCGLAIEGVNAPGHFLVRVRAQEGWMLIDPFYKGEYLAGKEVYERLSRVTGRQIPEDPRYLPKATHRQWVARILANLQNLFASQERRDDLAAMTELQALLGEMLI